MNIVYRKNTLYVYLNERIDREVLESMEQKVNNIMRIYDIDNLVIQTCKEDEEYLNNFVSRYNRLHKSNVIVK